MKKKDTMKKESSTATSGRFCQPQERVVPTSPTAASMLKLGYQRFGAVLADPPWMESGGGKVKRGADRHYPLMKTADIANLPVQAIAKPDSHLWLWVTNNFLEDGLQVMNAWGFRYVTNIAWVKQRDGKLQQGLGQYIRGSHELLLFGVRGRPPYRTIDGKRAQVPSVIIAPRTEHSAKPTEAHDAVERVSAGPYVELFARRDTGIWPLRTMRLGWSPWGNEVDDG
jgi:N6-adenosine-specific RNA methylase IME4